MGAAISLTSPRIPAMVPTACAAWPLAALTFDDAGSTSPITGTFEAATHNAHYTVWVTHDSQ